jgi:hypothetical protein
MAQVAYVIEDDGALVVRWLSSDIIRHLWRQETAKPLPVHSGTSIMPPG